MCLYISLFCIFIFFLSYKISFLCSCPYYYEFSQKLGKIGLLIPVFKMEKEGLTKSTVDTQWS